MKKTFVFVFIFLLSALSGAFAEKGYNGLSWHSKLNNIKIKENYDNWEIAPDYNIITFSSVKLGDKRLTNYIFKNGKLAGICYCIENNLLKELTQNLKGKKEVLRIQTKLFTSNELKDEIDELKKNNNTPKFITDSVYSQAVLLLLMGNISTYGVSENTEQSGYKNIEPAKEKSDGVGTLYIYDYNDDTRVYIASGNIEGLAFVAYVPHAQDY